MNAVTFGFLFSNMNTIIRNLVMIAPPIFWLLIANTIVCGSLGADENSVSTNYFSPEKTTIKTENMSRYSFTDNPLKIALINNDPPLTTRLPNGKPAGYAIEFWSLWSKVANVPVEFISTTYQQSLADLKSGKVEIQAGLFFNLERDQWADFSLPITEIKTSVYYADDTKSLAPLSSLTGRKVAVGIGTYQEQVLRSKYPNLEIVTFYEGSAIIPKLLNHEISAIVSEDAYMNTQLKMLGIHGVLQKSKKALMRNTVHGLVQKNNHELLTLVNNGIKAIPIDRLVALEKKWFTNREPYFSRLQNNYVSSLSMAEIEWLKNNNTLVIGVSPNLPPFETFDGSTGYSGISADYMEILSEKLGIRFLPAKNLSWTEVLAQSKKQKIDLIPTVVKTEKREVFLNFTKHYLKFPLVIATRQTSNIIQGLNDFLGKKVGVEQSTPAEYIVKDEFPNVELILFKNAEHGLNALTSGKIQAFVHNSAVIMNQKRTGEFSDIGIAAFTGYDIKISMGVRKGLEPLVGILNKTLAHIDEKRKMRIANKWLALEVNFGTKLTNVLIWFVPILLFFTLSSLYVININRKLGIEIAKREKTEISLSKAKEKAEMANKAKDEFLANVTHEIRTPMNAVVGMSEMLRTTQLNQQQIDYIDTLSSSSNTLLNLINQILDLSKIEAGKMELESIEFPFMNMISEIEKKAGPLLLNQNTTLKLQVDDNVPDNVKGDGYKLSQILLNLLTNAIKFTKEGKIKVSVSSKQLAKRKVELYLCVEDTGIGMSPEQVASLFDTYNQADSSSSREFQGSGIGLSICKKLCELMGGKLWVESLLGVGSKFSFTVQFSERENEPSEISDSASKLHGMKVLIVDDNITNQIVIEKMLVNANVVVTKVGDGLQCLERLENLGYNDFDLILMDIQMPNMNGYEAAREIRSRFGNVIAIVALSANTSSADMEKSIASGMNAHLGKPVGLNELYETLGRFV